MQLAVAIVWAGAIIGVMAMLHYVPPVITITIHHKNENIQAETKMMSEDELKKINAEVADKPVVSFQEALSHAMSELGGTDG